MKINVDNDKMMLMIYRNNGDADNNGYDNNDYNTNNNNTMLHTVEYDVA